MILICGGDTFSSLRRLKNITKEGALSELSFFNLKEDGWDDISDTLRARTIFNNKRTIVIKKPFENNSLVKNMELLESSPHNIILYHQGKPPKNKLSNSAQKEEFKRPKKKRLKDWVKKEAQRHHISLSPKALEAIIKRTKGDLWALNQELLKLSSWKNATSSNEAQIEKEDIDKFLSEPLEENIFKIIDAVANQNKGQALDLVHGAINRGDHPLYLLSMIAYQFSNLLAVKDKLKKGQSPQELDLHHFVIQKSTQMSKNFSFQRLEDIFQKIADLDYEVKTGQIDQELALDVLLSFITSDN